MFINLKKKKRILLYLGWIYVAEAKTHPCPIPLLGWVSMGRIQIAVPTPYNHIIDG